MGIYKYRETIDGVTFAAEVVPVGRKRFAFLMQATGTRLNGVENPVPVRLSIGDDNGNTTVRAQFVH
jgi:hypothetical protein